MTEYTEPLAEPLSTNRGVQRHNNTEWLSSCIDWCQITVKEKISVERVIEEILRIPLPLMFGNVPIKGFSGHQVIAGFGNIKLAVPTGKMQYEGYQILISGSGCRDYEYFLKANHETWIDFFQRVQQYDVNFPRIDLAIDDRKPYLNISSLITLCNDNLVSSRFRTTSSYGSRTHTETESLSNGDTLYFGSSSSNIRIVFYEKGYEQAVKFGTDINTNWNRYELRFRDESAKEVIKTLCTHSDIAKIACGILKDKIRFLEKPDSQNLNRKRLYPTYQPWAEFLQDIQNVKLCMKPNSLDEYLQKNRDWLIKNVAPSIKMQMQWDKMTNRENGILEEISHARLNEKQRLALETFEKHQELKKYL